jgi:hypothetical protein
MNKKAFVFALLDDDGAYQAFQQSFWTWFDGMDMVQRNGANGCYSLVRRSGAYLTGSQMKVWAWWKKYMPDPYSEWEFVSKWRMEFRQFLLLTERDHLVMRFYSMAKDAPVLCFGEGDRSEGYDGSHLCNDAECENPNHLVADPYWVNREMRRCCPGPNHCVCWRSDTRVPLHFGVRCWLPGQLYTSWNQ